MRILEDIGDRVEAAWDARGRDPKAFADVAASAILEADLQKNLDPDALLRHVQTAPYVDQRGDNEYGEPALTIARKPGFRVEVIFWMDGVANVHGHVAEGAFYVLTGERLHATYDLDAKDTTTPGLVLADLRLTDVELLQPGDLRKIYPGFRSVHALVFVGRPCVTVSVRAVEGDVPFYLYANPHVLVDLAMPRTKMERRYRAFEFFVRNHWDERLAMARRILEGADVDILLARGLLLAVRGNVSDEAYASLLGRARERFGDWIDRVIDAGDEIARMRSLEALLPLAGDRGARLLLGLVWTRADRAMAARVLARAFPEADPTAFPAMIDRFRAALTGPRTPSEDAAAALGSVEESEAEGLVRAWVTRVTRFNGP